MAMKADTAVSITREINAGRGGAPATAASAVTQSNATADPAGPFRFLKVMAAGNVEILDLEGNTVLYSGVLAGDYIWCGCTRVNDTNTTVTDANIIGHR